MCAGDTRVSGSKALCVLWVVKGGALSAPIGVCVFGVKERHC